MSEKNQNIKDALFLKFPAMSKEIMDICIRYGQLENARHTGLDAKAAGLLSSIGLAIALFTGCSLQFLANDPIRKIITSLHTVDKYAVIICTSVSMLTVIASAGAGLWCLRIRKYQYLNEAAIFNKDALHTMETCETEEFAVHEYRRYLIPNMWSAFKHDMVNNDKKAKALLVGQILFALFLFALGLSFAVIARVMFFI